MRPGPAAWRPLLDAALCERALDTVREIAEALRDPPHATAPVPLNDEESRASDLGLFTGRAGIALFFAYLSETGLAPDAEDLAWRFLEEAESGLSEHWMSHSLCEGFTGVAWTHAHLHQAMAGEPDRGSLKQIDESILDLLEEWPWPDQYELLYGLAGIGIYALERLPRPRARAMIRLVVDRLWQSAERLPGDLITWRDPGAATDRRGRYNLGVAHGVPGVVAFLARAAGVPGAGRKAVELLKGALRWQDTQRLAAELGGGFPAFATPGEPSMACRVAWCYGDPGIAAAMYAAGRALNQIGLEREAVDLLVSAADRPDDETMVHDAGLCHGAAGLGQLYNRLFQSSGESRLGSAALHWYARVLELRRPGTGVAGFAPAWPVEDGGVKPGPPDPGFLTGAAGIGLALLAASTPVEPAWDRLLLLDVASVRTGHRPDRLAGWATERR